MTNFEAIDASALATVNGGNRVELLEKLIKRLSSSDLTKKQIGKLDKKLDKFEAKGGGNAIAEGDFGAAPSNYLPITGD